MSQKRLIHCTFSKDMIGEPLLYNLGRDFEVVPNIRGASITEDLGEVYLELEGSDSEVERAVSFLRERGVTLRDVDDLPKPGQG